MPAATVLFPDRKVILPKALLSLYKSAQIGLAVVISQIALVCLVTHLKVDKLILVIIVKLENIYNYYNT